MKKSNCKQIDTAKKSASVGIRGETWNSSLMVADGVLNLNLNIPSALHELVLDQFFGILPHLVQNSDYTPEDLLGDLFWNALSDHNKRLACVCLKQQFDNTLGSWHYRPDGVHGLLFSTDKRA